MWAWWCHLSRWFFSSVVEGAERALLRNDRLYETSAEVGDERRSVFEHFLRRRQWMP
jgi:hypothetical protein